MTNCREFSIHSLARIGSSLLPIPDGFYDVYTTYETPADENEIAASWADWRPIPELAELWTTTRKATIYQDRGSGLDGVELLSPAESRAETQRLRDQYEIDEDSFANSDIVFGLLTTEAHRIVFDVESDPPCVRLALDIGDRSDWPIIGRSIADFLMRLRDGIDDHRWQESI